MASTIFEDFESDLVPRFQNQGYDQEALFSRRRWLEEKTHAPLDHVAGMPVPSVDMQGNIENPIGTAQVPLGIAGPLLVKGIDANGTFYVPLATTEGALVRSYERGMAVLTRAGGVTARIHLDENCIAPVFCFEDLPAADEFASRVKAHIDEIRKQAEGTTQHGKLLRIEPYIQGRNVALRFHYYSADAHGMNMIAKATDVACRWIVKHLGSQQYYLYSGLESEKHASGVLFTACKGKRVTAGALVARDLLSLYLRVTPVEMTKLWQQTVVGHIQAHSVGYNGHFANGLAAVFIACGQDVGNLPNCAVGITSFELTKSGHLYAAVTLPSLTVATIGGGTGYGTAKECLGLLGCNGANRAPKFAEIIAATLLAGELSIGAAIISGEFVAAHERYGRNRPKPTLGSATSHPE